MMYKLVNGLLADIISEVCMVNNEVPDHFTRQSYFLHTRIFRSCTIADAFMYVFFSAFLT